jgi:hypothetical protein
LKAVEREVLRGIKRKKPRRWGFKYREPGRHPWLSEIRRRRREIALQTIL